MSKKNRKKKQAREDYKRVLYARTLKYTWNREK